MRRLRHLAILLTLTGILLRGFMPMGWMPDAQGALTLCSIDGAHRSIPDNQPAKQDHGDMACPFAAAAHLAPPPVAAFLSALHSEAVAPPLQTARLSPASARHNPHTPRAPPFFA